ncbi:MAG: hypothetical protein COA78_23665 [Blastopirellula sp.]|nr:MAG: hypothetical protein COA78_23665 [Blastopirellula sp.]
MTSQPIIQYLNTDLDLIVDVDPAVLTVELEANDLYVHVTAGEDGLWYLWCEDLKDGDPETNIVNLLNSIGSLSESARKIWESCTKREFDIGYDCGDEPWGFTQGVSADSIKRIADYGISLRITLYPYRESSSQPVSLD